MLVRIIAMLLCLFAAISCYAMGRHGGMVVFVLLGVLFEMVFWIVLTRRAQPAAKISKTY